MVELLDRWIHAVGPLGYVALLLAAFIEYVFPPFPGDTVVLLGGVFAVRGERPWLLVLLAVTLGSVAGAAVDFYIGKRLAQRFESGEHFAERHPQLSSLHERMRRHGMWLIAFNRFLPGVRGPLFAAAGASGMNFRRVMLWGAFSAVLWNALIMGVGSAVGGNAERLESLLGQYYQVAWILVAAVVVAFVARLAWKARRSPGAK